MATENEGERIMRGILQRVAQLSASTTACERVTDYGISGGSMHAAIEAARDLLDDLETLRDGVESGELPLARE
jgi:hypothetical protein